MSFDEAVAALQASSEAEVAADAEPLVIETSEASETTPTPSESAPVVPAPAVDDSFTKADLTSLLDGVDDPAARERIEVAYKSFQGDYTRKTQELAEKSKAFEGLGDPDAIRNALEFQTALSDPTNWPQVHAELTAALENMGMAPAAAAAEASSQMQDAAPAVPDPARPSLEDLDDPDVKAYLEGLESRFDSLSETIQAERAAQKQEQELLALAGELTRQETAIRQANKSYDDDDINAIYELSSYYRGNLFQAEQAYKSQNDRAIERYIAQKGSVQDTPGIHPFPGAGVASGQTIEPTELSDKDVDALAKMLIDETGALENF